MTNQTLAQILILTLLILTNARFIFIKNVKADSFCTLPFISVLISVLSIISSGCSLLNGIMLVLSIWCAIWNFRSLLRFSSKLVIDHYGIMFKLISVINLLITLFAAFLVFTFRPIKPNQKKFMINQERTVLEGNFERGFKQSDKLFTKSYCELYKITSSHNDPVPIEYSPHNPIEYYEKPKAPVKTVLFIPPKTAEITAYLSFAYKLAYDGYTVYMAQFFADDMKWFPNWKNKTFMRSESFKILKFRHPENYSTIIKYAPQRFEKEFEALYKLAAPEPESQVYLVTEEDLSGSLERFVKNHPDKITGTYDIADTSAYKSAGYGPVENYDPAFAFILKLTPERLGYMSSHIAQELEKNLF